MKALNMNSIFQKNFFRKHRKKALIIYLCWWVFKGLLFLLVGLLLR
jgi:hypothetical protein